MSNLWPILRHNQNLVQHGGEIGGRLMREINEGPELVVGNEGEDELEAAC